MTTEEAKITFIENMKPVEVNYEPQYERISITADTPQVIANVETCSAPIKN